MGDFDDELVSDPVLGPIVRKLGEAHERLQAHEARLGAHEDGFLRREYMGQLADLGRHYNARYNKDGKGKAWDQSAFLDFALRRRTPDLGLAYDSFTLEDERALAVREGEERGRRRADREASAPRRYTPPPKPAGLPASFQELDDEGYLNDPDMIPEGED